MKRIYIKLIILALISIIPVMAFNYIVDPYGIFKNDGLNLWYAPGFEPNQHYAKMRYLLNGSHSFDSFVFGSSRVGKIDPDLISDGNYYNMNYSEGLPGEHLRDIQILLDNGIPIKNVMIGVDNFSYVMSPEEHRWQIMRHPYDDSALKRFFFLVKYLCSVPRLDMVRNRLQTAKESTINFNVLGNGMQNLERIDQRIERNIEQHVESPRFDNANPVSFNRDSADKYLRLMDNVLRDIEKIVLLSKRYNFNAVFFVNPVHIKYYLEGNPYHFLEFKKRLAEITGYWDFSGFNSITTDNYYYYETSHFRTMVGDMIICRIRGCSNIHVPEDFGIFITRETVIDHIERQKENLRTAGRKKYGQYTE